jgi:hypothetical protein
MGSLARWLLPRMRRHLGMNCLRILERTPGMASAARTPAGIACRVLAEKEVVAFAADRALDMDAQWVRNAYARGALCLGALQNGRLAGYTWLAYGDTPFARGVWIALDPALRYSYKSFVRPECRGQRIIQALHAFADQPALWRGRRRSIDFVAAENFASLSALDRTGARTLGYVTYVRLFGALIAFRSAGMRRAGIGLYAPPARRIADRMRAWLDPSQRSSA